MLFTSFTAVFILRHQGRKKDLQINSITQSKFVLRLSLLNKSFFHSGHIDKLFCIINTDKNSDGDDETVGTQMGGCQ